MARPRKKPIEIEEEQVSVLDTTESDIPVMGVGEVVEEEIKPWNDEARLAEKQMLGDMANMVMDRIKTLPTVWLKMSPSQQQDVVSSVTAGCQGIVRNAIEIMASKGRRIITGIMKQVTIKDEIQMTITCLRSPEACAAMGMAAAGGTVAFLLLETEGLLALGDPIQVGMVQGELNLDSLTMECSHLPVEIPPYPPWTEDHPCAICTSSACFDAAQIDCDPQSQECPL
ncbi:MAG: hypothetical protein HQL95_12745 [Magnetococcales bacterium]|nr:hypothetical protein [Magnetococcales bacterium]